MGKLRSGQHCAHQHSQMGKLRKLARTWLETPPLPSNAWHLQVINCLAVHMCLPPCACCSAQPGVQLKLGTCLHSYSCLPAPLLSPAASSRVGQLEIKYRSPQQEHSFGHPYQLGEPLGGCAAACKQVLGWQAG